MLRVSVNMRLQSQKPFLKELFKSIELSRLVQTGSISFKKSMLEEIDKVVIESLNDLLLPAIRRNLIDNKSMFTGTLYSALNFTSTKPGQVVLEGPDKNSGSRDYARILESGGPKGKQAPRKVDPAEARNIVRWVIYKRNVSPEKATVAAKHVIRKIEKEGSNPHPYIQPAVDLMMPAVRDLVHTRLSDVLGVK